MNKVLGIVAAVLAVFTTGTVLAQSTPWYGGLAWGKSKSNVDAGEVNDYVRSVA